MWLAHDGDKFWHQGLEPLVEVAADPSVPLVLPYQFEGRELTDSQLENAGDTQLLVAYEVVVDQIDSPSD